MSNGYKWPMILLLLLLLLGASVAGCATVPLFNPSVSLKQTESLEQGALLCNEYSIPRSERTRPIVLRPFMDCVDELFAVHTPEADSAFSVFRTELQKQYGVLREGYWSPSLSAEYETAIHGILKSLGWSKAGGEGPTFSPSEREMALRHFPASARKLRADKWVVSVKSVPNLQDPKLDSLTMGVEELSKVFRHVMEQDIALCERLFKLQSEAKYLANIRRDFEDIEQIAPQSRIGQNLRDTYDKRLSLATEELKALKSTENALVFSPSSCKSPK